VQHGCSFRSQLSNSFLRRRGAQSSAYPSVKSRKGASIGVFEMLKPAFDSLVNIMDYEFKTMSIASPGLEAYRLFDFRKTLFAWPSSIPGEVISKKIKPTLRLRQVGDFSFLQMQKQSFFFNQPADHRQDATDTYANTSSRIHWARRWFSLAYLGI
jgi:hypothetical protein